MKVLVTGSRDWADYITIREALKASGATFVIHGAARGADTLAKRAAIELGIGERGYPAQWKEFGKRAGPIRNSLMIAREHVAADPIALVLAFFLGKSSGTWDMVNKAERAGIERRLFRPGL